MKPKSTVQKELQERTLVKKETIIDIADPTGENDMTTEEKDQEESLDKSRSIEDGMQDDDDEFYEEEIMLLADFDMYLKMDEIADPNVLVKVIGIDTENPIIQVNEDVYRGTYDSAFGTNVFFEKDPERTAKLDPVFENGIKQMYRFVDKSEKVLRMKRIFATQKDKPKGSNATDVAQNTTSSDEEHFDGKYEVDMTYEDALNLHLPDGGYPPRHIDDRQNGTSLMKDKSIPNPKIEQDETPMNE